MKAKQPDKVKLFVGVLTRFADLLPLVRNRLAEIFGPVDLESEPIPFVYTNYYRKEMGDGLFKLFLSFQELIDPGELANCKHTTNEIEEAFKAVERSVERPINLDPGYIDLSKLVLASTKNFYHRIYLNSGIYAEVTLYFKDKKYNPLPWTYSDYKSTAYHEVFATMRKLYQQAMVSES